MQQLSVSRRKENQDIDPCDISHILFMTIILNCPEVRFFMLLRAIYSTQNRDICSRQTGDFKVRRKQNDLVYPAIV